MTLQNALNEKYIKGRAEGESIGLEKERARYTKLYRCLKTDNRLDLLDNPEIDIDRLYKEYGIE